MPEQTTILLATLNARYIHASLGLRYLYANLRELQSRSVIREYVIATPPSEIVEDILKYQPSIVGLGVYIWNVVQTEQVAALLKQIRPDIKLVLGGPEVSYETELQTITGYADYVITGNADHIFYELCRDLCAEKPPGEKIIPAPFVTLENIEMPYEYYNEDDVANRIIYVEASRGCPYKCEFCLSALDKTAWPFDVDRFLAAMTRLYERGVRHFKFVDRTFNLKIETSVKILEFFLQRASDNLFLHFELIPDHLPQRLREMIEKFPAGTLQFEIGIQTLNPDVQALISRKQNNDKAEANIRWLREHSHAHLHTDLIAGLPGETMQSFSEGFDRLYSMNPHEIQLGILKRLRGTPIIRHTSQYDLRFNPFPPYNVLSTRNLNFSDLQRLNRFARYWDILINSGRIPNTKNLLLKTTPFTRFLEFTDWLFEQSGTTYNIALEKMFDFLSRWLINEDNNDETDVRKNITGDYILSGLKSLPRCVDLEQIKRAKKSASTDVAANTQRQSRHRIN